MYAHIPRVFDVKLTSWFFTKISNIAILIYILIIIAYEKVFALVKFVKKENSFPIF